MTAKTKTTSPTALLLERAIDYSGLTQREIADRAGFSTPNIISMMKKGETKVPIDRIPAIARACGIDPAQFIATAMNEYQPEVWKVIVESMGPFLTDTEIELLSISRAAAFASGGETEIEEDISVFLEHLFQLLAKMQREGDDS